MLGDVAEQPPHDLAAAGLRQLRREDDVRRLGDRADLVGDVAAQLLEHLDRALVAALERDVGDDRLARSLVLAAADRGLGDLRVVDERALDLDRRDPVAGDVHHVVHAAEQPEVAVLVDAGAVAGEVDVRILRPVRLPVALVVVVDPAQHRRPGAPQHEVAPTARADLVALLVEDRGVHARERPGRRAGLERRHSRQRRDHDHPRLGLPPRVDDRRAVAADVLAVPDPRLRVDRLADRAEQPQRGEVVLLRVLRAPLHVRPDRRRRRVEDVHLVALDDRPPAVLVREVRDALVDARRSSRCRAARRRCSCGR